MLYGAGPSAFQPDGRITFNGTFTVISGTGRFEDAYGTLQYDGWARTTDFATGQGIGFLTITGILRGTTVRRHAPSAYADNRIGTILNDGQDFVFQGSGVSTSVGLFKDAAQSFPGPFRAAFIGLIDGRFILSSSYESVWTTRKGDKVKFSAIEFIAFEILTLPDGSPAPDLSKPSKTEIFQTVESGTGQYKKAQGVFFGKGTFDPTSPDTVAAEWKPTGFFSMSDGKGSKK